MLKSRTTLYIIIVIITGFYFQTEIFPQSITFNHLTVEDGLSNNDVNTLIQDRTGFIWFGTDDGLNRYDGYNFKVFRNIPNDSTSLSDNSIWALMEDSRGTIWIGTKDGILNQFDLVTEKFSRWVFKNKNGTTSSITALFEDDEKIFGLVQEAGV
ncbi:MAG: hypothetical protein IPJ23_11095 [Ignavibacteriales bacterium]|nr:hypothetical protein [Ignavibacteriales bacterium]